MPIRGESTARLASGRTLTLKVNFATLAHVSADLGMPTGEVFDVLRNKADPRQGIACLSLVEQALKRHHPEIDEDAVGDLLISDESAIAEALMAAFAGAFGAGDGEGRKPANPRRAKTKAGTSTSSSSRGRKRS